ncbi:MAG: PAS domain-containing protein [Candidatus Competibacteraceae bacterium]
MASHRQTAAALRGENWIRSIADAVPALIAYIDSNLHYGFANKKHEDWFGKAPADMIGRPFQEIIGAKLYERLQPHVQAAFRGKEEASNTRLRRSRGSPWKCVLPSSPTAVSMARY